MLSRVVVVLSLLPVYLSANGLQVRWTGTAAINQNSSTPSVSSSSVVCTHCLVGDPQNNFVDFQWPEILWSSTEVATVIYQVNTILDITITTTKYAELTGAGSSGALSLATNDVSFWESALGTTGVVVVDGTPTVTLKHTIYTDPGAFITVTAVVTSPSSYFNMGFLAFLVTSTANRSPLAATDSCVAAPASTFGITPTAVLPGYNNPYQVPLDLKEWKDLLPQTLSSCNINPPALGVSAVEVVSALTATTTIYDNNVHAPNTSPTPQNSLASPGTSPQPVQAATAVPSSTSTTSIAAAPQSVVQTSAKASSPAPAPGSTVQKSSPQNTPQVSVAAVAQQSTASLLSSAQTTNHPNPVSAPPPPSSPAVVVNGQTISPGASAVTIGGTPLSLAPSSSLLVVGTKTYTPGISPSAIAIGSLTITLAGATTPAAPLVVNGQTISAGAPAVTIDGTAISLAPSSSLFVVGTNTYTPGVGSSAIVVGSRTIAIVGTETTPAASGGLGSLIWSGIGGSVTASSAPTAPLATYIGAAPAMRVPAPLDIVALLVRWIVGCVP